MLPPEPEPAPAPPSAARGSFGRALASLHGQQASAGFADARAAARAAYVAELDAQVAAKASSKARAKAEDEDGRGENHLRLVNGPNRFGYSPLHTACYHERLAAVEYLRANYSLPFVGMEPAVKPAVARTRSGVIGVLVAPL
jgi:hypothetical protein